MIFIRLNKNPDSNQLPAEIFDSHIRIPEPFSFLTNLLIRGSAHTTLRAYAYDLLSFYRFLRTNKLSLSNFSQKYALRYISILKNNHKAPRTINRRIIVIKSFLNSLKQNSGNIIFASSSSRFYKGQRNTALLGPSRIKSSNPLTLKLKVPSTLKLPIQFDHIHSFINKLRSYRDRAILALMLCAGLRSCEIIDLQIHDIDLDNSLIRVRGKGDKERLVPISPWIKSSISTYLSLERPHRKHSTCFVVLKGKRIGQYMHPEGLRKIFRHRRSGLLKHLHPHSFRHTFCTNLIRQKVPLPIVQKLMGHASIDTTLIYINLSLEDIYADYIRAISEFDKLYPYDKTKITS